MLYWRQSLLEKKKLALSFSKIYVFGKFELLSNQVPPPRNEYSSNEMASLILDYIKHRIMNIEMMCACKLYQLV